MGAELQLAEVRTLANSAMQSGMFGIKNQEQAFTLMIIAQAEGVHPIQAMQMYDIIQGRPALKATEVLSRFQKSGGKIQWIETTDKIATAKFVHPQGGEATVSYTIEDAQKAGLTGKDNWNKRPKEMLRARCSSSGVRMVYPACLNNMHTVEEVAEFEPLEDNQEVQTVEVVEEAPQHTKIDEAKGKLWVKLKSINYDKLNAKDFVTHHKLENDLERIEMLLNDDEKFKNAVANFENPQG